MPNLNGNYIDLIIIAILIFFLIESLRHGFWILLSDFVSFLGSLVISLWIYKYIAELLRINFSLPNSFANAIGFVLAAAIIEMTLGYIFGRIIGSVPEKKWNTPFNKWAGIIPGIGEGLLLVTFFIVVAMAVPIKPQIKSDIESSRLGSIFLKNAGVIEKSVNEVFGGVIEDSLTYLTIKPGSTEVIPLTVDKYNLKVDNEAEKEMFALINKERSKESVKELVWSEKLAEVARLHGDDMWKRKYFGHVSPDGKDVGDRLDQMKIYYTFAGENLAMAPTVSTAHKGLMNSEGHRANILDKRYGKVGVGVVDNGVFGKMFVQVFTN
jgi:uncharacterized protein YkwD